MKKSSPIKIFFIITLMGLFFILLLSGCISKTNSLTENQDKGRIVLYFFWGDGCPHCASAKLELAGMNEKYPDLAIRAYEVYYIPENQQYYLQMADKFGVPDAGRGVPLLMLDNTYWIGWSDGIKNEIEQKILVCVERACVDAGAGIMPGAVSGVVNPESASSNLIDSTRNEINLFGIKVNLENQPLLASTILISLVDGFNPCSIWVLSMLLALTIHSGSRKKVLVIGVVFLTITAAIYAMFIAGIFTFLSILSFTPWIQGIVAIVAIFFAAVNIKDYFWYKEGVSFTILDERKPGIFKRMRKVLDASESFWGMIGATVILAAGVSLVEFSCTAGFPVLWSNLLTAQKVTTGIFALLLLVYMIVYQLDELAIFFTAVVTLRASKLEEKQGRILKLTGGTLMLTLGLVMLINPAYMNSLTGALVVFGIAFVLVLIVLLFHRKILPAYGIWIGTEADGRQKSKRKKQPRKVARH